MHARLVLACVVSDLSYFELVFESVVVPRRLQEMFILSHWNSGVS